MIKKKYIDGDFYDCMLIIAEENGGVKPHLYFDVFPNGPACVYGMAIFVSSPDEKNVLVGTIFSSLGITILNNAGISVPTADRAIIAEQVARGLTVYDRVPLPEVFKRLGIERK